MNYFLSVIILGVCAGAYYEHTLNSQRITDLEKQLKDQTAEVVVLQTTVENITADNAQLKKNLDAAQASSAAASAAPVTAPPAQ